MRHRAADFCRASLALDPHLGNNHAPGNRCIKGRREDFLPVRGRLRWVSGSGCCLPTRLEACLLALLMPMRPRMKSIALARKASQTTAIGRSQVEIGCHLLQCQSLGAHTSPRQFLSGLVDRGTVVDDLLNEGTSLFGCNIMLSFTIKISWQKQHQQNASTKLSFIHRAYNFIQYYPRQPFQCR